jgi:EmrB/QacA subfamily drug resistance transporter
MSEPAEASAAPGGEPDALAPGTKMALVAMGLGVFVIANDFTALNIAIPAIESDFDVDVGTAQWVVNAYALTFGLAIVTGGRLADMFGRRKLFFIGATIFAGFSALAGVAPSIGWLIGARVGMGIGGAIVWPAILGMTFAALPASRAAFAGGLILGVAGVGNAVGPLLGGALTEALSWRWIFFVNVPIAIFAVAVTWAKVHQKEEHQRSRIDYPGIATLSASLLLLLVGLDQASDWGFGDLRTIGMLALSALLLVAFAVIEPRRGEDALVPESVIANARFRACCLVVLLMSGVFFTLILYVPQFFIKVRDMSAFEAGLGLLPLMATFAATSFAAERISGRIGVKATIVAGCGLLALGAFLLSFLSPDQAYASLVPGLVVVGVGVGLFYATITAAAVTALPESQSSLAGGLVYMFQIAGGAIGLGAVTTIFTTRSEAELGDLASGTGVALTEHQQSVMHGLLAGTDSATSALGELSTSVRDEITEFVRQSFVSGLEFSLRVVAAVAFAGFVIAVLRIRGPEDPEPAPGADPTTTGPPPSERLVTEGS